MARILRDALIMVGMTVAILCAVEVALRVSFPQWNPQPFRYPLEADPEAILRLKPNLHERLLRETENGGYIVEWRTNSHGFRGPELEADPDRRVIVYGDSNVQASFSGLARTFVVRLERLLEGSLPGETEVINAGMNGAGPDQSLIRLQRDLARYEPDLVVFHVFADNDYGDLVRNRLFDLGPDGELVRRPLAGDPGAEYLEGIRPPLWSRFLQRTFINHAVLVLGRRDAAPAAPRNRKPMEMIRTLREVSRKEFAVYRAGEATRPALWFDHYDTDVAIEPAQPAAKVKIGLMDGVLAEAKAFCEANGVGFLVVIQPSIADLTEDNYFMGYADLERFPGYRRTNLVDPLDAICRRHEIPCVNLFPVFEAAGPEDLYFEWGNDHWNDAGQKLAAQTVAAYVLEQGLLPVDRAP